MKLCRSNDDSRIAGVCGGVAEHLGWDSGRVRIVWVLATIFSAAFPGVILYLALWYLMPEEAPAAPTFDPPPQQPWKKTNI
jgi:phage shock protein PspC (stress-responsive transcriptional regulator)